LAATVGSAAKRRMTLLSLALGVDVFIIDRVHKYLQIETFGWKGGEFHAVTPFFDYVLVWNTGISYSLLAGLSPAVLLLFMGAALAFIAVWWWRADTVLAKWGLAIVLGGALSHIVDRLIYGAVPDFFHLHWGEYSFYVFNIADTAITLGVVLLLFDMLRARKT
jgi:signal peptidase II